MGLSDILGGILKPASEAYKAHQDRKANEDALEQALQVKKLELMAQAESAEVALSIAQINSAGWKDEWFTVIFSLPLVAAFVPQLVDYVQAGFAVLETMPVWYKAYLGSAVAAAFGLHTVDKAWKWWNS